jgi:pimeloyl-ACP methyl ester carboxylesterase
LLLPSNHTHRATTLTRQDGVDPIRRNLARGAAAAATAAAPHVFAQQVDQGGSFKFWQHPHPLPGGGHRVCAAGHPGRGGVNSRISNWTTGHQCDGGVQERLPLPHYGPAQCHRRESTGPIPVDDPWGAFADDRLGLMDHLGIRQFVFFGNCIGGSFALKLMERAPERIVPGVASRSATARRTPT